MPPDRSEIGLEQETSEKVDKQLRVLIQHCAQHASDAKEALIGALYNSYMNEARPAALDDTPLRRDLAAIAGVHDRAQFARLLAESRSGLGSDVFTLAIQPDAQRPINILTLGQGGLGLPDRDYFLARNFASQRGAYEAYVARTLRMVGATKPEEAPKSIVAFETRIASASWTQAERREIDKTYNPMSVAELQTYAPGFDWHAYMERAKLGHLDRLVLAENTAVRDIAAILAQTPFETLKDWETFHTADNASPFLSRRFVESHFGFHNHDLLGASDAATGAPGDRPSQFQPRGCRRAQVRRAILPAHNESADRNHGDAAEERDERANPRRLMDERQHPYGGAEQAWGHESLRWLSRALAQLHRPQTDT